MQEKINNILSGFEPISLQQMESVKLMNRIDTKYVVSVYELPELLDLARQSYFVQEIDGKRIAAYDTMYYDTDELDMYIRHHDRQLVRQKIRVREYVYSALEFIEIKRKNNKGRTKKKRIEIPVGTDLSKDSPTTELVRDFVSTKSNYTLDTISPKLRTEFNRITLVNKAKTERLTIDMNLSWTNQQNGVSKMYDDLVIVELKRDGNVSSPMLSIMQQMRIHQLKVSKYCIGTALTNPELKRNRFKNKIRKIEKLLLTKRMRNYNNQ